jgi:mono/diheme cytochrome c family protein
MQRVWPPQLAVTAVGASRFAAMRTLRVVAAGLGMAAVSLVAVACGGDSAPATPSDPILAQGQQIYNANCARCHGKGGNGSGVGPKLAGVVANKYPDIADQEAVISGGRGSMPKFDGQLTPEEITMVARYEREVLGSE